MSATVEQDREGTRLLSERVRCEVARGNGTVCALSGGRKMGNLLAGPVAVSLTDEATGETFPLTDPPTAWQSEVASGRARLHFGQEVPGSGLLVTTELCLLDDLTWTLGIKNRTYRRREITVGFEFPALTEGWKAFLPASVPHPEWERCVHQYGYRCNENTFRHVKLDPDIGLCIPALTLYRPAGEAAGITIMSPLESPIQPFSVRLDGTLKSALVQRRQLRIEPRKSASTALLIGFHEGDWRPGLAYVKSRHPALFAPRNPELSALNGGFCFSGPVSDAVIQDLKARGVRWVEVHPIHPFHGKYDHDRESWVSIKDDHWHFDKLNPDAPPDDCPLADALAYIESRWPKNMSRTRIRDFIDRLHAQGIKAFLYIMPTEVLALHVFESFPDDAILDIDGRTVRNWNELILVNPDPDGRWGRHFLRMLDHLLETYPEADGIFLDEGYTDRLDYAHDDGWSIDGGRPASRMGYAIVRLLREIDDRLRGRGKGMMWNGPFQIETAAFADAMYNEAGQPEIQYLALDDKPLAGPIPGGRELLCGMQRAAMLEEWTVERAADKLCDAEAGPQNEAALPYDALMPLFEEMRRRTWVLTANPVSVPDGIEANIFRTLEGNILVPLFSSWSSGSGGRFSFDVPVTVSEDVLEAEGGLRAVYLLSADLPGWFRLDWTRRDGRVRIDVPRHYRNSLLVLATTGVFAGVHGPMTAFSGEAADRELVVENWTAHEQRVRLRVDERVDEHDIPATGALRQAFRAPDGEQVLVELEGETFHRRFGQTIPRLDPLEITCFGELDGVVGQVKALRMTVFNNNAERGAIRLSAAGDGLQVDGLPASIELDAHERGSRDLRVALATPGVGELRIVAEDGEHRAEVRVPAAAAATDFFGGRPISFGCVEYDLFSIDGQTDPRPSAGRGPGKEGLRTVLLDGQRIGAIGVIDMDERWFPFRSLPIPGPSLMALGRELSLEIHAADPDDFFMIRNVRVALYDGVPDWEFPSGGPMAATNRVEQVFSTRHHVNAKGEIGTPIRIALKWLPKTPANSNAQASGTRQRG